MIGQNEISVVKCRVERDESKKTQQEEGLC